MNPDSRASPPDDAPLALVVEDEPSIRRFVRQALEGAGWRVVEAGSLRQGLAESRVRAPELVIVDLGLPDGEGTELVRDLRSRSRAPVVVLSARTDEQQKVEALDAGADDYIEKPFGVPELLARVRAHVRRRASEAEAAAGAVIGDASLSIDLGARIVRRDGAEVHLTKTEYELLAFLARNAGRVLTHRALLREVWGPAQVEHPEYLRVVMGRLRHKLERDPTRPTALLTETGVGYRFIDPATRAVG